MAMHIQGINLYNISLSIFDKMFLEDEHNYRRMLCTESLLYRVRLAWHTIDWSTPHPTHTNTHVHAQKKNEKKTIHLEKSTPVYQILLRLNIIFCGFVI